MRLLRDCSAGQAQAQQARRQQAENSPVGTSPQTCFPVDAPIHRFPSAGACRSRYRSGWWKARHGPAIPARCAGRRRPAADGWRRNGAGHAAWPVRTGPARPRSRCIRPCASRGLIGLPAPRQEQRRCRRAGKRNLLGIGVDRLAQQRQHRHHAFLAALAQDGERFAQGHIAALEAQRLGNAQARAIEQASAAPHRARPASRHHARPLPRSPAPHRSRSRAAAGGASGAACGRRAGAAFSRIFSRARKR